MGSVDDLIARVRKDHGEDSIMRLGTQPPKPCDVISSGSLSVDEALGVGGFPRGRIIEIFGPESSGKTTLALHAIAQAQALGGVAAFVDAEHALDLTYAKALGVDVKALLVSQPDSGEQALSIVETEAESGVVDIIVVDSVAALTPQAELDGEMGEATMGVHARLMSQAMRKLTGKVAKASCVVIFINQLRSKIGVIYGSPEVTTGGNALKFYASMRIDVRRREQLKTGDDAYGNRTQIKVVKNKLAPPFKEVDVNIVWGKGIDRVEDIFTVGVNRGVIEKAGAWYSHGGERIGQGVNNCVKNLTEHPEWLAKIESEVRGKK